MYRTHQQSRRPILGTLWRSTKFAAFAGATWFLALPQLPLVWRSLGALAGINVGVLALGIGCAFGALLAYAQLTRTLLDDGDRPGIWHLLGIVTTSLGINRVMPAGAAASSLMTFRLLERAGVPRRRAAFAMTTQSVGSTIVLNMLLWLAVLVMLPTTGFAASYLIAASTGMTVFAAVALITDALLHRRGWLWTSVAACARRLPAVNPDSVTDILEDQATRLTELSSRPHTILRALGWAIANWLLDAAALWIFLAAFGVTLNPVVVLVAFALANIVTFLPITPGGLGVVELTLVATLTGFGAAAIPVALGVAAYRVFNYWAPIPASALAYLSVRRISGPTFAAPAVTISETG